ncbi:MAG: hypothetical protein QW165_03790 [Candidatus Woesearchaeota archaeon]
MRSTYLFIFLLLFSVTVLAQSATFTISVLRGADTYTVDAKLFTATPIKSAQTYTHDFGINAYTTKITAFVRLKPCLFREKTYTGCGTITLCAKPEGQPEVCQTLLNQDVQTITFDFNKNIKKVTFTATGSRKTNDYDALLVTLARYTGLTNQFSRQLISLRGTQPILLGKVRELINTSNASEASIISSTMQAPAWFDDGTGTSATSRTVTSNFNDNTYACLNIDSNTDANGNPKCDYFDEADCATKGKDWLAGNCCGDAPYLPASGCQWYSDKQAVCGKDATGVWKWAALEDIGLVVKYSGSCPSAQIVSNGQKFHTCNIDISSIVPATLTANIAGIIAIHGHDYICQGENIIECGGETPYSPGALPTGASITIAGKKNYCTASGTFKLSITDRTTCEKAGLTWTGTQCCGEPDDPLQTYEDTYTGTGTAGACYNGQFLPSGTFLDAQKTILISRGEYFQCSPNIATQTTATLPGTSITTTVKPACGMPMLGVLLTGTKPNAVCLPNGQWMFTSTTDTTVVKQTKWTVLEGEQQKGCCPDNQCWDGKTCKNIGDYYVIGDKGYLCQ